MDDLFSNSPKKDDFEDISSHSEMTDDFEDIFSDSQKEINDLFSEYPSANDKPPKAESNHDFDMSYFTDSNQYKSSSAREGNVKRDSVKYEDISSNSSGKKGGNKKKIVLTVVAIVLVLVIGVGGFVLFKWNDIISQLNYQKTEKNKYIDESDLSRDEGVINILLIGSDTRVGDTSGTRSDTTILLSVDKASKQLKLSSFLRDSYIEIPEKGHNKLNAAFSWGGSQLLIDTLEYNFKIDIDYYIAIDFEAFKDVVDKLGGIDIEITDNEARYINSQDHMTWVEREAFPERIEGGMNHFTGAQALWYCRIRYLDSDFNRTQRQRKTLNAALQKAKDKSITELLDIAKYGASLVTTDISKQQINSYTQQALSFMRYDIVGMQIPADGTWHSESTHAGDSLVFDLEANREKLYNFIYGGVYTEPTEAEEN